MYRSSFKVAGNALWLCAGGASKHVSINPPLNLIKRTNDEYSRKPHLHKTDVRRSAL